MFTSRDPSSGAIIQSFRSHSPIRIKRIVDRVSAAQVRWSATAPSERSGCLLRLAALLRAQRHLLASTLTDEMGKRTVEALGLKKVNASVEVEATPQILGMVRKVSHLVKVEEV